MAADRPRISRAGWFDLAIFVGVVCLLGIVSGLVGISVWRGFTAGNDIGDPSAVARAFQAERATVGLLVLVGMVGAAGLLGIWWMAPARRRKPAAVPANPSDLQIAESQLLRDLSEHGLLEIPVADGRAKLSPTTRRLLGLRELGPRSLRSALQHVRDADRQLFLQSVARAATPGASNRVSVRIRVPDPDTGMDRSLSVTGRVVEGSPSMLVALVQDVTARVEQSRYQQARTAWLEARMASRNAEVEVRAAQARQLSAELGRVEGVARRRLARQLHDGLQQTLAAARMRLALISGDNGIRRELDELLAEAINDSRNLAAELDPPVDPDEELGEALLWLQHRFKVLHDFNVDLQDTLPEGPLPSQHGVMLFRAAQELLFNVVKHAGVKEATVQVRHEGDYLTLRVRDEGVGVSGDAGVRGFGLGHLDLRLQALGGGIELSSAAEGLGCTATAWLPLR